MVISGSPKFFIVVLVGDKREKEGFSFFLKFSVGFASVILGDSEGIRESP